MKTLFIILAIYAVLDIIASIIVYLVFRKRGWNLMTMALAFRLLSKNSPEYFGLNSYSETDDDDEVDYE